MTRRDEHFVQDLTPYVPVISRGDKERYLVVGGEGWGLEFI